MSNGKVFNERDEMFDYIKFIIECSEVCIDDDIVLEGTNTQYLKSFSDAKNEISKLTRQIKKAIKAGRYNDAKKDINKVNNILDKVYADIKNIDDTVSEAVIGNIINMVISYIKLMAISIPITSVMNYAQSKATNKVFKSGNGTTPEGEKSLKNINRARTIGNIGMSFLSFEFLFRDLIKPMEEMGKTVSSNDKGSNPSSVNMYKNRLCATIKAMKDRNKKLEAHLEKCERAVKESAEVTIDNESEEIKMTEKRVFKERMELDKSYDDFQNFILTTESGEVFDYRDFLIECYQSVIDDDLILEGTNIESFKTFKTAKSEIKKLTKQIKKAIKNGKFADAKKDLDKVDAELDKVYNDIKNTDSTLLESVIGIAVSAVITYAKILITILPTNMAVTGGAAVAGRKIYNNKKAVADAAGVAMSGIPKSVTMLATASGIFSQGTVIGAYIIAFKDIIGQLLELINGLKNSKDVTPDVFNMYKNRLCAAIKVMKDKNKKLGAHLEKCEKELNAQKKKMEKNDKAVKESSDLDMERLSIYEACSNGDITLEEREELLNNITDKKIIAATTESDDVAFESAKEKFNKVKLALYEKCNNGEITVDARESLIDSARTMLFENTNQPVPAPNPEAADPKGKPADKPGNEPPDNEPTKTDTTSNVAQ